jgi:hypothetical protein
VTIVNTADVQLQATTPRMVAVVLTGTIDFTNVIGSTKPSNNADVTVTTVNGGLVVTSGGITLSAGGSIKGGQSSYNTGTGFFLGYESGAYKFSIGDSSGNRLTWDGGALGIVGGLSGTSTINITGTATFNGVTPTSLDYGAAVYALSTTVSTHGLVGIGGPAGGLYPTPAGVFAYGVARGVWAASLSGTAGYFSCVGGTAIEAYGPTTLNGSLAVNGVMTINNSFLVSNLNADFFRGYNPGDFSAVGHDHSGVYLPIGGTAADSSALGGFGATNYLRQAGIVGGSPGAATHTLSVTASGITVRIPVVYP